MNITNGYSKSCTKPMEINSNPTLNIIIKILTEKKTVTRKNISHGHYGQKRDPDISTTVVVKTLMDIIEEFGNTFGQDWYTLLTLQANFSNLPVKILLILYDTIYQYYKDGYNSYNDNYVMGKDTVDARKRSVNKFGIFLYDSIRNNIKTSDECVLLFFIIDRLVSPESRTYFQRSDIEYAQSHVLRNFLRKYKFSGPDRDLKELLVIDETFTTKFTFNNDHHFKIWKLDSYKKIIGVMNKRKWFTSGKIFRYYWSFAKYRELTQQEFLFSLSSNTILKYLNYNSYYFSNKDDTTGVSQAALFGSRLNYFLSKYPDSVFLILSDIPKYLVSILTLAHIYFNKNSPPFGLNSTSCSLLGKMFRRITINQLLVSITEFRKICQTAIDDPKLQIKSHIQKNYTNNNHFLRTNIVSGFASLYKSHVANKAADDMELMIWMKSDTFRLINQGKKEISWYDITTSRPVAACKLITRGPNPILARGQNQNPNPVPNVIPIKQRLPIRRSCKITLKNISSEDMKCPIRLKHVIIFGLKTFSNTNNKVRLDEKWPVKYTGSSQTNKQHILRLLY